MPQEWDGHEYADQFGKAASFYPPKETIVETSPDKRRSSSRIMSVDQGKGLTLLLEVRGLGVLSLDVTGHPETGRLEVVRSSTFTDQMLQFGLEAEESHPCHSKT